ncbi:hydrolase, NUDIX family [Oesophagostomum dentatum]|uniref:Hydrolase, NUDIX family n=1 Tax=Oesophagostomum dentatum TaxID=61180 RepID=A0A0B1T6S9_OESDE|nr:hydrolase, NUDIX family [Oesophagostomum dentatum]
MVISDEEYIAESRDPTPEPRPEFIEGECRYVRLHDNVNYVAAGIILRGEGPETEVLLIQEAKKTCYGKWYMPAGRVEAGETLENAVKREVREESGYECDVIELLSLEVQGSGWYRFSFYCEIASEFSNQ